MTSINRLRMDQEIEIISDMMPKNYTQLYRSEYELRLKFKCNAGELYTIFIQVPETYPSEGLPLWYTDEEDPRITNAVQMVSEMGDRITQRIIFTQVSLLLKELYEKFGIPDKPPLLQGISSLLGTVTNSLTKSPIAALENIGNTCFLNSVLYTLRFAPSFLHKLHHVALDEEKNLNKRFKTRSRIEENRTIIGCLHDMYTALHRNEHEVRLKTYRPNKLLEKIRQIDDNYKGNREHDAQEFLSFLLNAIKETELTCPDSDSNREQFLENRKILCEDFQGVSVIKTICLECERFSVIEENIYPCVISIPVRRVKNDDPGAVSLESYFKFLILTQEYFSDENKISCKECLHVNEGKQLYNYEKLPRLLILHLKRFYTFKNKMEKINDYMPTTFTLPCYCEECQNTDPSSKPPHWYSLYSIIVHIGLTLTSGHYKCFVRTLKSSQKCKASRAQAQCKCKVSECCTVGLKNQQIIVGEDLEDFWFECNDSVINILSADELSNILSADSGKNEENKMTPYLLFYVKMDV